MLEVSAVTVLLFREGNEAKRVTTELGTTILLQVQGVRKLIHPVNGDGSVRYSSRRDDICTTNCCAYTRKLVTAVVTGWLEKFSCI